MVDVGSQNAHQLPENMSPVAGVPWDVHVPDPRWSKAPPPPRQRPVPIQPCVHIEPQNFPPVNDFGNRRPDGDRQDIPPPIGNIVVRGQPQDLRYNGMEDYELAHYPLPAPPPPAEYHDRGNNNYARVAQGVPAQPEVIAPPVPEFDILDYVDQHAAAYPGLPHLDELPHQVPALGEPAAEILRRLANRYLNHPDSQVDMVRMEPGVAGGIRMVITLELADLL